jgi:hypothetical protein
MVQLDPTDSWVPQLLVSAKAPETATLLTVRVSLPVFVNVSDCGELVVLSVWLGKTKLDGARTAE